jgi:hypothetical protein
VDHAGVEAERDVGVGDPVDRAAHALAGIGRSALAVAVAARRGVVVGLEDAPDRLVEGLFHEDERLRHIGLRAALTGDPDRLSH